MTTGKIKICHFVNIITGTTDGVYTHILMLLKNLDPEKYEQILVFHGGDKITSEVSALGIKVIELPSLNKKFSLRVFKDFVEVVTTNNVDIIQAHLLKPYIIAGLVNIFLTRKVIFNYNGLFIDNVYYSYGEKLIYKIFHLIISIFGSVDLAVVPSKTSAKLLEDETSGFKKVLVYYNGYNKLTRNPSEESENILTLPENVFVIGIVARLEIQKRIDKSLLLIRELINRGLAIKGVFIGDGPLKDNMISLSRELNLEDYVIFLGYRHNICDYYKYFDVLLFTSDWEGFPLSIWEAMAAGIPIVSTDVGGIREVIEAENCGFIYPCNYMEEGINHIITLYNQPKLRKTMGRNGSEALATKYSINNFRSFFEELYKDLSIK